MALCKGSADWTLSLSLAQNSDHAGQQAHEATTGLAVSDKSVKVEMGFPMLGFPESRLKGKTGISYNRVQKNMDSVSSS